MDSTTFDSYVEAAGVRRKPLYTLRELEKILGIPYSTLRDECNAGRMTYHLPKGRKNGKLVRPEWVDEWIEDGTHARP